MIVFLLFFFWFVYLNQKFQEWTHTGPQPKLWLWIAIFATLGSAILVLATISNRATLQSGELGERHVADVLEELRRDGYRPIHDIVGDGFNVDHVLVGPGGIFAIETKYRSGKGDITVRNDGVFVGDRLEEKDCLKQALASAAAIRQLIHENCAKREWVNAIVVFVGNWKIRNKWRDTNVRVFTPERLLDHIRDQQPQLIRTDIQLIASHLERSVKS